VLSATPPAPDPYPGSGHSPIVYVPYSYDTPAQVKGHPYQFIPGWFFRCTVDIRAKRYCIKFHR
jgi:hypothetical protein